MSETKLYTILIIDDDFAHIKLIEKNFRRYGKDINIITESNISSSKPLISETKPDLIVTDLILPDGEGIEILDFNDRDIPIIIMSAFGDEKKAVASIKKGAYDYFVKSPEAFQKLPDLVFRALEYYESQRKMKRAEEALQESKLMYSSLVNTANDAIISTKSDGEITFVNNAALNLFTYKSFDTFPKNIKDILVYNQSFVNIRNSNIEEIFSTDSTISTVAYNSNGRLIDTEISLAKWFQRNEEFYTFIIRDVRERVNSRKKLEQSEEKFKKSFYTSPDAILITEMRTGKIIDVNQGFSKLTGYLGTDVIGKTLEEYDFFSSNLKQVLFVDKFLDRQELRNIDIQFSRKDGQILYCLLSSNVIYLNNKLHVISIIRDITELKKVQKEVEQLNLELEDRVVERTTQYQKALEEIQKEMEQRVHVEIKLQEANAAKDKFFSIIAHDLKNPLQALLLSSDLLERYFKSRNMEKLESHIQKVANLSDRFHKLLENLLVWSRSQSGGIKFYPEKIHIVKKSIEVIEDFKIHEPNRNYRIIDELGSSFFVYADDNMLSTIFRNLIANSIKFTSENADIIIRLQERGNNLKVEIEDTGIGIKEEDLDKLFRIDAYHTTEGLRKEKGSGLGLIICKEFVKKMGGDIWVQSKFESGSKFIFTVPRYRINLS